jgi:hypothetical protein
MKMSAIVILIVGGAALILYSWFEKRIGQHPCMECGAKVSVDNIEEKCSNCRSLI